MYITNSDFIISEEDMHVTLSPSTPNKTINIEITDDNELEGTEYFTLQLNFIGVETHRLNLKPSSATITILDNDGIK